MIQFIEERNGGAASGRRNFESSEIPSDLKILLEQ